MSRQLAMIVSKMVDFSGDVERRTRSSGNVPNKIIDHAAAPQDIVCNQGCAPYAGPQVEVTQDRCTSDLLEVSCAQFGHDSLFSFRGTRFGRPEKTRVRAWVSNKLNNVAAHEDQVCAVLFMLLSVVQGNRSDRKDGFM